MCVAAIESCKLTAAVPPMTFKLALRVARAPGMSRSPMGRTIVGAVAEPDSFNTHDCGGRPCKLEAYS